MAEKKEKSNRIVFLDVVKAIAIILVIVGHAIQYGTGQALQGTRLLEFGVFKYIYSFHMPLFMLVSGYLFRFTIEKKSFIEVVKRKNEAMLIPIACWSIISFFLDVIVFKVLPIRPVMFGTIRCYISIMVRNLWFLWAILFCSVIVAIGHTFLKDNILYHIVILVLLFFIFDKYNLALYKFMYPYFLMGYYFNQSKVEIWIHRMPHKMYFAVLFLLFLLYVLAMQLFSVDSYIYTTGYTLLGKDVLKQLYIDIYRCLVGLLGSVVVLMIIWCSYMYYLRFLIRVLMVIGGNTIGIYIISGYLFNYVLPKLTENLVDINWGLIIGECIVILFASLALTYIIKRFEVMRVLLLGQRRRTKS